MIPEAGTRSELKAILMKVCSLYPLRGEKYEVMPWGWVGDKACLGTEADSCNYVFLHQRGSEWGHSISRKQWREMLAKGEIKFIGYAD